MDHPLSLYRCATCRGTYHDPGLDGAPYFHVCPPLPLRELTPEQLALAEQGAVFLRNGHRDERPRDTLRDSLDGERPMLPQLTEPRLAGRELVEE